MKRDYLDLDELKELKLADPPHNIDRLDIDILIGNDFYGLLMTGEIIKFGSGGIVAMSSKLGWLLSGPVTKDKGDQTHNALCQRINVQPAEDDPLEDILPKFWEISTIETSEEDSTLKSFEETIEFNQETGRYVVRLPWKQNKQELPSNFGISKKRLESLRRNLNKRDPTLIDKYAKQISEQLKQGFIEKVYDFNKPKGVLHYIPHLPVFKLDSATTKMRIVYDASAKISSKTLSLNDCLYTGPNLLQELSGILLKFRLHKIAFTADIEKAFLQIELNEEDRDATRFLWLKDANKSADDMKNLDVYRFCRVLFGAAPSPFLLGATIQHHLNLKEVVHGDHVHGQCCERNKQRSGSHDILHMLSKLPTRSGYELASVDHKLVTT
ncbi:hypothetical protein QZH41_001421 [Actinostola sp. cb2023]|nr:hypothetical protein QZH41_001421 [Actinostola sp. cb2023]